MIAFRAAASAQNATGGDVVVTKPTGTAEGDILLAITLRPDAGTWTLPSGWAWEDNDVPFVSYPDARAGLAWKRAGASEPSDYTFGRTGLGSADSVAIAAYAGVVGSGNPIEAYSTNSVASTTVTAATITTTSAYAARVALVAASSAITAASSGMTLRFTSSPAVEMVFDVVQEAAGASGTMTFSNDIYSGFWMAWHIALTPATSTDVVFVASTMNSATAATTSCVLTKPTGAAAGDLLIAALNIENNNPTVTPPSGWSLIYSATPTGTARAIRQLTYQKLLTSGDDGTSSFTWTVTTGYEWAGICACYRNAQAPTVSAASTTNSSSVSAVAPTVTRSGAGARVVHVASSAYGTTWTPPSSPQAYTERADRRSSTGTSNVSIMLSDSWYAAAGATGTVTATAANADYWTAGQIVLEVVVSGTTYPQTNTGALTPSGAAVQQGRKALGGALTPAGALPRAVSALRAGVLMPAGVLLKRANRNAAGALAPTGVLTALRAVLLVLVGTLTPAGVVLRSVGARWTGAVTPAGALLRRAGKSATGALAPVGAVARSVTKIVSGALTPSGALAAIKTLLRVFVGALAPTGAVVRSAGKAATGSLAPAGALFKRAARIVAGALAPVGLVLKRAQRLWTGALAGAGALTTQIVTGAQTFYVSVAGALAPSGALLKRAQRAFASSLTPAGAVVRRVARHMVGALTPTGAFAALKVLLRTFTGALAPAGSVVRRAGRGMAGQLAAAGVLVRTTARRWAGSLAPTGGVTIARALLLLLAGALAPSGAMVRNVATQISGALTPAGALTRSIGKWLSGALAAAGGLLTQVFGNPNVRLTVTLADAAVTACVLGDRALTACTVANAALTTCIAGDSALTLCAVGDVAATRLTLGDTLYE